MITSLNILGGFSKSEGGAVVVEKKNIWLFAKFGGVDFFSSHFLQSIAVPVMGEKIRFV